MDLGLDGTRVIVTGGTKGLGGGIVRGFLREGARVITNYHRDVAAAQKLLASIPAEHFSRLSVFNKDISSPDEAVDLVQLAHVHFHGLDIMVNNAAIIDDPREDPFIFTDREFDRVFHTNVKGLLHLSRAAMALMIPNGQGRIINLSSAGVHTGSPKELLYACSKGSVEAATRAFAAHGAKHNISVNAIAPHLIRSGMALSRANDPASLSRTPLGRPGEEEEVVDLVLFLASSLCSYMTGAIVPLDGGRLLAR